MVFIDSNTWCYYFDSSAEEHEQVSEELERVLEEEEITMNTIVLMEVAHYLITNLGSVEGKEKIDTLLSFPFEVVDFTYRSFEDSVDYLSRYAHTGIGGRDATILASMEAADEEQLVTHDQAFKDVDSIEVLDPAE
ncbi:MAG: type II toxin-antitoxin system VapC family toxin [Candidatus Nanohaloarchaea archaeon]|nr:type II toxin-antitoxin system VapC family toxin [Candidatus Nanohaloarchaea archaeon]